MSIRSHGLVVPVYLYTSIFLLMLATVTNAQVLTLPVYDTTFIRSYPNDIIGRVYLSQKYLDLEVMNHNDAPRLRYKSNTTLNLGIGATYKNLTINLAYGFGFLNHDEQKGKTKKLDLQSRLYSRKWAIDLYGQLYKEYYAYPKGRGSSNENDYYIRQDLKVNLVGITAYKIINYTRFTLHPAFIQDEVQLRSAGSLLAGAQVYYGNFMKKLLNPQ